MRLSSVAIILLLSSPHAWTQDGKAIKERFTLVKPERDVFVTCLSNLVDRAKSEAMSEVEFKGAWSRACINEREAFRKALLDKVAEDLGPDPSKREAMADWLIKLLFVPILNEYSGTSAYRYRLKNAEKAKTPTPDDLAITSAKQLYAECLATLGERSRIIRLSEDEFRTSLDRECLAEADSVRKAELQVWRTYERPPRNLEAAGKLAIRNAKAKAQHSYGKSVK